MVHVSSCFCEERNEERHERPGSGGQVVSFLVNHLVVIDYDVPVPLARPVPARAEHEVVPCLFSFFCGDELAEGVEGLEGVALAITFEDEGWDCNVDACVDVGGEVGGRGTGVDEQRTVGMGGEEGGEGGRVERAGIQAGTGG